MQVRREGGLKQPVSLKYESVDGTAKAGEDFEKAEGTKHESSKGSISPRPARVAGKEREAEISVSEGAAQVTARS